MQVQMPTWSIGAVIALLVIIVALIFALLGRLDPMTAALFIALGLARLF